MPPCYWDFMGTVSQHKQKRSYHSTCTGLLALTMFLPPFPQCSLNRRYMDCVVDLSVEAGHPMVGILANCGSMWESPPVAKRSFYDEGWELQLSADFTSGKENLFSLGQGSSWSQQVCLWHTEWKIYLPMWPIPCGQKGSFSNRRLGRSHILTLIPPLKKRCYFFPLASPGEF